jgi:endonuclease/exonuclease/phosphatase family metal-dependent hydrolase
LIIAYVSFGSLYKFASAKDIESEGNFKVMNYNVRLFNLFKWIPEDGVETSIVDFIKNEAPDVLSIQEYHPHEHVNLSSFKYKFEKLSGKKFKYGQAIFSKFPIINSGSVGFPNTANNAIFADVVKGKDTIRVYNIHLESLKINTKIESLKKEKSEKLLARAGIAFKRQQNQAELFLEHKKNCKYKVIVCGDFNNTAFSYVYRKIKGDLKDSFKEAGTGFGRTHEFQFIPMRIDFIFADQAFSVNSFKSYKDHFSDHFPISATLSLE